MTECKEIQRIRWGQIRERYRVGDEVYLKPGRGVDPSLHTIHKVLGDGQYLLSRDATFDHVIYSQDSLQNSEVTVRNHDIVQPPPMTSSGQSAQGKVKMESQRLSPEEKLGEGDDKDFDEELAVFLGLSLRRSVLNSFSRSDVKMIVSGDIDDTKLLIDKTTRDAVQEQKQTPTTATEQSTEVDDAHSVLRRVSVAKVREKISAESDRRMYQQSLKNAEVWSLKNVPSMFSLGERPLEKGKTRKRWRCACGRNMYDDFTELRSGAAAELEKWLNHSMRNHAVSDPLNPSSTATLRSFVSPNAPSSRHQQTAESDISLQRRIDALGGYSGNAATTLDVHLEKCWLLVCGNSKRGPDCLLTQLDLSHTPSDNNLFIEMRKFYSNLRNSWNLRSLLRGVKTIRFVQLELHKMARVDIRKVPDMPPETRRDEYLYEPCGLIPPVGENFMSHWFQHPEEAWDLLYAYSRFPKKRKGELEVNPAQGPRVGWGIQIVEDWVVSRLWLLGLTVFLCGSLAFGICWTILEHDIQGAFGVSAYVVALLTLVVGAAQASLG